MGHGLGGGFKYGLFSSLFGEMIQFDEHIFQMGWFNHQLAGVVAVAAGAAWMSLPPPQKFPHPYGIPKKKKKLHLPSSQTPLAMRATATFCFVTTYNS